MGRTQSAARVRVSLRCIPVLGQATKELLERTFRGRCFARGYVGGARSEVSIVSTGTLFPQASAGAILEWHGKNQAAPWGNVVGERTAGRCGRQSGALKGALS